MRRALFENYFGLIEAAFVFGLAIAFYIWQMRDLRRYKDKDRKGRNDRPGDGDNA